MSKVSSGKSFSAKTLKLAFEDHNSFDAASRRLKELTFKFGNGGMICRSESGFAILGTTPFIARISASAEVSPAKTRTDAKVNTVSAVQLTAARQVVGSTTATQVRVLNRSRLEQMVLELRHAYQHLPSSAAKEWTGNVLKRMGDSFTKRVGNIVDLSVFVLDKTGEIIIDLAKATLRGEPLAHLKGRGLAGLAVGMETIEKAGSVLGNVLTELRTRPDKIAPELLISSLAFFIVGGGLDGDGGVPDQDIEIFGIGGHRSIFTHSIVAGTLIETSLYALVDLVTIAHKHLPRNHDPLWDEIYSRSHSLAGGAVRGSSAGLAYHLAVDSIIEPAPYHDLPFPAPIEVHQAISGVNSAVEGNRAISSNLQNDDPDERLRRAREEHRRMSRPEENAAPQAKNLLVGAAAIISFFLSF